MINKLLIKILKYKKQKLIYSKCRICEMKRCCDDCRTYYTRIDIEDIIKHLKGRKI